jgi:predicted Rdx family selenoprotein
MRIDAPKSGSSPAQEPHETFAVSNQQLPHTGVFPQPGSNLLPSLELGQELDAIVVEELPGGKLLLNVAGAVIAADNPGGLSAGQHLRLRVRATSAPSRTAHHPFRSEH